MVKVKKNFDSKKSIHLGAIHLSQSCILRGLRHLTYDDLDIYQKCKHPMGVGLVRAPAKYIKIHRHLHTYAVFVLYVKLNNDFVTFFIETLCLISRQHGVGHG